MNGRQEVMKDTLDMEIMKVSKTGSNATKKHMMSVVQNIQNIGIATCLLKTVKILYGTTAFGMTLIAINKVKHRTKKDSILVTSTVTLMPYATHKVQNQNILTLSNHS